MAVRLGDAHWRRPRVGLAIAILAPLLGCSGDRRAQAIKEEKAIAPSPPIAAGSFAAQLDALIMAERPPGKTVTALGRCLAIADLRTFKKGTDLHGLMVSLRGAGNFEFALTDSEGCNWQMVSFGVGGECYAGLGVEKYVVWALFRERKFERFVDWIKPEMMISDWQGRRVPRLKPLSMSETILRIENTLDAPEVGIAYVEERARAVPGAAGGHLTLADLVPGAVEQMLEGIGKEFVRNADLRQRYCGLRWAMGASRAEVESFLGVPASEAREGPWDVAVYRSGQNLNFGFPIHHSPLIVAYTESSVVAMVGSEFAMALDVHLINRR